MNRHLSLLLTLLLVGALLITACAAPAPSAPAPAEQPPAAQEPPAEEPVAEEPAVEEPAGFDWRMLEGETLRIAMVTQPWSQFLEPYIGEFEELSGMDVTYEILPEDQFRQKTTIEFASGVSDVDVFLSMVAQEGIKYESAGWYADFTELLNNPAITDPDFDFADFTESSLGIATLPNGKLIGLPVYNEFGALFYNKALFDAAGVPYPPATIEEVEAAAAAITDPANGIYGFVGRGAGPAATSQFSSLLHSFGSEWIDAEGNANVLDPKFVEAIDWYGSMLRNYGPQGTTSYSWQQGQDVFLQGKAGMWMDASVFFANLVDPELSTVLDSVGVTMAPEAEVRTPYVGGWHLSIYEGSPKKEAAWLFVQWALGKEMVKRAQLNNITTGRASAWNSEEYKAQNEYPEFAEVYLEAMTIADSRWNPPVLAVSEARDAVGAVIVLSIEGEDFMAEAEKANEVLQRLLDDTPDLEAYP
jgi:multiple sugar transport system substrate-binding protein